jgi:hypothetical protein
VAGSGIVDVGVVTETENVTGSVAEVVDGGVSSLPPHAATVALIRSATGTHFRTE